MNSTFPFLLQDQQHPLIRDLANSILACWQSELELASYEPPPGLGYVEGKLEGDRLVIQNYCYQTPQFRKLHLELAQVGQNLDILHCVMFPRLEYDLPMFGCDLVGGRGGISAAIADLSPLNPARKLPENYHSLLSQLPSVDFQQVRDLPEWGDIFSEFCLFIRPSSPAEEVSFLDRVKSMLIMHCQIAQKSTTVSVDQQQLNLTGQAYYCSKQRQNDKTRRVLEKAFGADWAEHYLTEMLFDLPYSSSKEQS